MNVIIRLVFLDQNGKPLAEGEGRSKKKAEQQAAKNSLLKLGIIFVSYIHFINLFKIKN